jgi:hypothetical protein
MVHNATRATLICDLPTLSSKSHGRVQVIQRAWQQDIQTVELRFSVRMVRGMIPGPAALTSL